MPSAYRFTHDTVERITREWIEVLDRDANHPAIVTWVPFNESWGVPNLKDNKAERHYVEALFHLTKTLDHSRLVVSNDGWESTATEIIGIHDYDADPQRIARRYHAEGLITRLLKKERPGGRSLFLGEPPASEHPLVLSEFGGIAFTPDPAAWGYSSARSSEEFAQQYTALLEVVRSLELLAGFCYTQFSDTYQEANGLLTPDRTPKFPLTEIQLATRGPRTPREEQADLEWRLRMMKFWRTHEP
jgi:hypothetical protein